ncbi:MAG: hypothetical protein KDD82_25165, partial [Planctomycetes bacterium]|nr:hypothetical protein [Planctomycetota bacterium]
LDDELLYLSSYEEGAWRVLGLELETGELRRHLVSGANPEYPAQERYHALQWAAGALFVCKEGRDGQVLRVDTSPAPALAWALHNDFQWEIPPVLASDGLYVVHNLGDDLRVIDPQRGELLGAIPSRTGLYGKPAVTADAVYVLNGGGYLLKYAKSRAR